MGAASANREARRTDGKLKSFLVAAATTIYKDTLVGVNADGYLVPMSDAAGLSFVGVAAEYVTNAGANGAKRCLVRRDGEYTFAYAGGNATQANVGDLVYAQDDQTVDEDASLTTNDYPVGHIVEVLSATEVRVDVGYVFDVADSVSTGMIADGAVTVSKLATTAKTQVTVIAIEDLAAGADIAARAEFVAPAGGCTLTKIGIVPKGNSAGIDDGNTAVVAIADAAGNSIVSKTYNTGTQPPAANTYASLGNLSATHKILTANEVVTVAVTQGATANLPGFNLIFEWIPTA